MTYGKIKHLFSSLFAFTYIYCLKIKRSIGWTLYNLCSLDDARFVLDEVNNFDNWLWPDLPRHYTRDLDKVFKM